jgi:hypothetical protein
MFPLQAEEPGTVVDIATRLRAGRSGVRIPAEVRDFSFLQNLPYLLWGLVSLVFNGYQGSFPGVKRPGREVNHSPPSSAEVKNEWSYTSTPPICLHCVDRENFAFLIFVPHTSYTKHPSHLP